jgi:hypothetical protein
MKANSRAFTVAMLASTFATMAVAQELGRVHFDISCTPQAQEKFDRDIVFYCDDRSERLETRTSNWDAAQSCLHQGGWKAVRVVEDWEHRCADCRRVG